MLRLENIKKDYTMKESVVPALKGISLCFRKSEFVSILGPSGCGKTTLLNILGGLDHYTSGDLIIDGKSTKEFNDHDWDVYRNHRIGFIFQSYNLIPHENILENVELALTIAGISKEEREERAKKALDRVGLSGMYKKKPNQLSGGQCQRVAIARALVNEPEILLADEPTGALDSETSVQIMELIKEISGEKLVIMVTHNPELAKKYSTRIISLLDGNVIGDTNPYSDEEEKKEREGKEAGFKEEKAKMSFFTAFKLSAKNLWTKVKRTAMVIIAASIGIIGVSAVLSVSNGVTGYIDSMQDEMMSGNPISISRSAFDLSAMMSSATNVDKEQIVQEGTKDGYINVNFMIEKLIKSAEQMGNSMISNDITQEYVDYIDAIGKDNYADITKYYGINPNNNIYTEDDIEGYEKGTFFSISSIMSIASSILGQTDYDSYSSMISTLGDTLSQSLTNPDYIASQYDVVEGKIATEEDEIMIILSSTEEVTDFTLTLLGYFSQSDFMNLIYKFTDDERYDQAKFERAKQIALKELMNKRFTYYPNDTIFKKNNNNSTNSQRPFYYSFKEDNSWNTGLDLKVVGVLKPKEGRMYNSLGSGFYYTPKFTERFINDNIHSEVATFVSDYCEEKNADGYPSGKVELSNSSTSITYGIYYEYSIIYDGEYTDDIGFVGSSGSSMAQMLQMMMGSGSSKTFLLSKEAIGASNLPTTIYFYPRTFEEKYLITDYLDIWNSEEDITVKGTVIHAKDRAEIKYSDNLEIVISMINTVIDIVTIALICFTALSLVVSTVMISIITYVSVMERIKEIGIIRALGGRKKDVSHLFNAETFMIGTLSGVFGIAVTYLLQTILNLIIKLNNPMIGMIGNLPWYTALIIIFISVLLTTIAGLIPASSAAKKDPVEALRTE